MMKMFLRKRGLSNMVGYVLLISIALVLAALVFSWLRFMVFTEDVPVCEEDSNVIIKSYTCCPGSGGNFSVTLENKGLFTVDGYTIRVHDRPGATFGAYLFEEDGFEISPDGERVEEYEFSDVVEGKVVETITGIEVQPYMVSGDGKSNCRAYAFQEVVCDASSCK